MTVWVVTLNGYVQGVCASPEAADAQMAAHRAQHAHEGAWRPVGTVGWASPQTTSLARRAWVLDQP